MRSIFLSLALATLAFGTTNLHADTFDPPSLATGADIDALVHATVNIGGVAADQYTYTNTTIGLLGFGGAVLSDSTSVFTATYVDVTGLAGVLSISDVCVSVDILGPAVPCQAFAFSFNNVKLGNGLLGDGTVALDLVANVNAGLGFGSFAIASGSVAGGSGTINFTPPPSGGGGVAATPEPSSLILMATGLVTAAGTMRRRFLATA